MPTQPNEEWEIVDELPGERKPKARQNKLVALARSKALWIGLVVGGIAVIVFPILRLFLQNLIRSWWIWVGLLAIWYWRRLQRSNAKRRS